ncbi:MAG: cytochrome c maturation protein CcmE [Actinomycetia bacterium]|nr:cytochrome c maturation protein CcmE [Actinomycetes bacterium]
MKLKRKKVLAAAFVTIVTLLGLLVIVLRGSPANYWVTPAEYMAQGGAEGQHARVAGQVVSNSMDWDQANQQMVFKIRANGEKKILPVVYKGFVPDGFVNQSQVIVEGKMDGKSFDAQNMLVRCPENYTAERAVTGLFRTLKIEGQLYQ